MKIIPVVVLNNKNVQPYFMNFKGSHIFFTLFLISSNNDQTHHHQSSCVFHTYKIIKYTVTLRTKETSFINKNPFIIKKMKYSRIKLTIIEAYNIGQ